jgi:glutamate-1-semialdehyde aminotransferase
VEFVKETRSITEKCGAALIFDEVLTGFRNHPRGAKHFYGVEPDIATYGKIVGGGMPMGAVAGRAELIDWIDGGRWRFGDESHPGGNVTAFGGTFCKHPLSMAASLAALKYMEEEGPALQERVNAKMDALAEGLNAFFTEESFPFSIAHFGSVFRFESLGRYALALSPVELDLFFRSLLLQGVYTWERRICFLSTTHGEAELALVDGAVRETLLTMRGAGFFPKDDRA